MIRGIYPGDYKIYVKTGTGWNAATKSFANPGAEGYVADPGMAVPKIITFLSMPQYEEGELILSTSNATWI